MLIQRLLNAFAPSLPTLTRTQIDATITFAMTTGAIILVLFIVSAVQSRQRDRVAHSRHWVTLSGATSPDDAASNERTRSRNSHGGWR
jgi:hypothetical protein